MSDFIHRLSIIILVAIILAVSPLCGVFAECQKLGQYCGSPPTQTFPACCPFDTNANAQQSPLRCAGVDNGVGTCEIDENSNGSSGMGS